MKILECTQGDPVWWENHRGRATAGSFDRIMTPVKRQLSAKIDTYIAELIGQTLCGETMMPSGFVSKPMENGVVMEPEARRWLEMERGVELNQIGMMLTDDGRFGASPDSLAGDDGLVEIKCPTPAVHIGYLLEGVLPMAYLCQCHGELIVSEGSRHYVEFISYCPPLPAFIVRVVPDSFTTALRACLESFYERYQECLAKVRSIGSALEIGK